MSHAIHNPGCFDASFFFSSVQRPPPAAALTPPHPRPSAADTRVRELADAYVSAFFDQFPEQATYYGVPGRRHDRLSDNSLERARRVARAGGSMARGREGDRPRCGDRVATAARHVRHPARSAGVVGRVARVPHRVMEREPDDRLAGEPGVPRHDSARRSAMQARQDALARWGSLPKYLDTEIANLREGMKLGYTAPRHIVRIVIDQVRTLAASPPADSPFATPGNSDKTPEFQKAFAALTMQQIVPAARRYADFLEREYLPAARETIAVTANPNGAGVLRRQHPRRSARWRSRQERCTTPACARSRGSTAR